MKKLMSVALGLSLLAPVASFAQKKPVEKEAAVESADKTKGKKCNQGKTTEKKEKGKKGSGGSTTPPPK